MLLATRVVPWDWQMTASASVLRAFLLDHVELSSTVITDGWPSYPPACGNDYAHEPVVVSGSGHEAHELLPAVHRVASLLKRWLAGTHQGGVQPAHLQAYLDEFGFRFNRRNSRARGMLFYRLLEQSVQATPRTYRSLVARQAGVAARCRSHRTTSVCTPTALTNRSSIDHGESGFNQDRLRSHCTEMESPFPDHLVNP